MISKQWSYTLVCIDNFVFLVFIERAHQDVLVFVFVWIVSLLIDFNLLLNVSELLQTILLFTYKIHNLRVKHYVKLNQLNEVRLKINDDVIGLTGFHIVFNNFDANFQNLIEVLIFFRYTIPKVLNVLSNFIGLRLVLDEHRFCLSDFIYIQNVHFIFSLLQFFYCLNAQYHKLLEILFLLSTFENVLLTIELVKWRVELLIHIDLNKCI